MKNKNVGMIITTGWSIRNFLRTDCVKVLSENTNLTVITTKDHYHKISSQANKLNFHVELISIQHNITRILNFILATIKFSYFRRKKTRFSKFILSDKKLIKNNIKNRIYLSRMKIFSFIGFLLNDAMLQFVLRNCWKIFIGVNNEIKMLRENKFDKIISTMPLSSREEYSLLIAAYTLRIDVSCIIQSWDNVTTKGIFPIKFKEYHVWSDYMKEVTLNEYDTIEQSQVIVSGAPQFDFYKRHDYIMDKAKLFKLMNLESDNPIIFWTGVAPGVFPNEKIALDIFLDHHQKGILDEDVNIIFRPHPVDTLNKYDDLLTKYPKLIINSSNKGLDEQLTDWHPTRDDMAIFSSILAHCSLNINMLSTITLDSFIFDKPVINIAFDEIEPGHSSKRLKAFYELDYYKWIVESNSLKVAYDIDQLIHFINQAKL